MNNMKLSIGVVVAVVLQVSGFVWWTAQQAVTIQDMEKRVAELTSRMAMEKTINTARDLAEIKKKQGELEEWIGELYYTTEELVEFAEFTENKWAQGYDEDPSYTRRFGVKE